jgi:hypothetical protein
MRVALQERHLLPKRVCSDDEVVERDLRHVNENLACGLCFLKKPAQQPWRLQGPPLVIQRDSTDR